MTDPTLLEQAFQAIQSGDSAQGQRLLAQALTADPQNEQAWLLLASCVADPQQKRYSLEKALAIAPDNPATLQALAELDAAAPSAADPTDMPDAILEAAETENQPPAAVETAPASSEAEQPASPVEEFAAPEDAQTPNLEPAIETSTAGAGEPAQASKAAATAPTTAPSRKPPVKKKSNGLSCAQIALLLLLAVLAAGALGGLLWVVLGQPGGLPGLPGAPAAPVAPPQAGAPGTPVVFELPPTWTWTPAASPTSLPTRTLLPSSTPADTPTPVASITPSGDEWRLVIGRSVKGEPLEVIRFGIGPSERLIVAGIHGGDEGNTIALADELIEHLRQNPQAVPAGVTLYILRSLNPDGEAIGPSSEGRLNADGVDLNRNFEANWKSSWSGASCASPAGSAGETPASEPETLAMMKFLLERQVEALVSYHSAGLGVFASGNPPDPASAALAQAIADVSGYPYPPVETDCEYTGTLIDWAAQNGTRAAVDVELSNKTDTDLEINLKVLDLLLNWETPEFITPTPTSTLTSTLATTAGVPITATLPAGITPSPGVTAASP